jgi:outer membrane immunogenic protein
LPVERGRAERAKRMKERPMRWGLCIAMVVGMASPALAADYDLPVLRGSVPPPVTTVGPATFTRWSGFYVGGDFSFNYGQADFSSTTQPLVALALQDTVVQQQFAPSQLQALGNGANSAFGFGGFLGYNTQWQDLILGVEANYTRTSLSMTAPSSTGIARSFSPPAGNVTSVAIDSAKAHFGLTDYAEARGRAGYIVGNLLPYGFIGVVVGRGDYSASIAVDATCTGGECMGFPLTPSVGQSNALLWGYTVGAGLDWALTQNVFLRGEFEFVEFAPIANINFFMVNARAGAGFKF